MALSVCYACCKSSFTSVLRSGPSTGIPLPCIQVQFDNKPAVLKLYDARHSLGREHFENEVGAYIHLKDLQGVCIPKVLAVARVHETGSLVLVLERPAVVQKYTPTVQQAAVSALKQLHDAGTLHGDVHLLQLVVCGEGRVLLTGLQYCTIGQDTESDEFKQKSQLEIDQLMHSFKEYEGRESTGKA